MSLTTIYDFNFASPAAVSREQYTTVGGSAFTLGLYGEAFSGGTDFEIWTAATGGTQLTEGTDYAISQNNARGDTFYSNQAGVTLYSDVTILNATYQTGSIYITYKDYGSYVSASAFNAIIAGVDPVGTIKPWHESASWLSASLSTAFHRCDGSLITNTASAGYNYRTPLLNNGSIAFSAAWVSGVATLAATDVSALLIGHSVTGGAIAAGAYITDITGNVVTISDTAISATVTTTFTETNGGRYLRGASASGVGSRDAAQRFLGSISGRNRGTSAMNYFYGASASGVLDADTDTNLGADSGPDTTNLNFSKLKIDNSAGGTYKTNGTGTGDGETSVLDMTVVYIIKVV